jgi:hypothetical protein
MLTVSHLYLCQFTHVEYPYSVHSVEWLIPVPWMTLTLTLRLVPTFQSFGPGVLGHSTEPVSTRVSLSSRRFGNSQFLIVMIPLAVCIILSLTNPEAPLVRTLLISSSGDIYHVTLCRHRRENPLYLIDRLALSGESEHIYGCGQYPTICTSKGSGSGSTTCIIVYANGAPLRQDTKRQ